MQFKLKRFEVVKCRPSRDHRREKGVAGVRDVLDVNYSSLCSSS